MTVLGLDGSDDLEKSSDSKAQHTTTYLVSSSLLAIL